MGVALARLWAAAALVTSGALMYAASWQRWAHDCPWGHDPDSLACNRAQDHLYDFVLPTDPWVPIGTAAQLAGVSLVVGALALPGLAVAMRPGRRPGPVTVLAVVVAVLAAVDVGVATWRSGHEGVVVPPVTDDLALSLWLLAPFGLLLWLGISVWIGEQARVRAGLAMALLLLGSPLIAFFSYAIGPFDAAPWWEATMGVFTAAGGLCVLLAGLRRPARRTSPIGAVATASRPGS
ncbi:hypothetical protein J2X46_004235 [Nocardioides sp. BE266]|uniref:hypothetical protein n=1 Tax=Nocardioides sp. BE266 TaxID=2817725 RepID=UPI0028599E52|nr:hypothetical protein [Nocardioides sp. BE266]MDR7255233.1 hypothetical protein [Nocardioides sp. BE266]